MNKLDSTSIKKQLRFQGAKHQAPLRNSNSAPHMLIQAADMIEAAEVKASKLPVNLMGAFDEIFKGG